MGIVAQNDEALVPVIRTIEDSFVIEIEVGENFQLTNAYLMVYCPSTIESSPEYLLTRYPLTYSDGRLIVTILPSFKVR
jgi:hypothetical protein